MLAEAGGRAARARARHRVAPADRSRPVAVPDDEPPPPGPDAGREAPVLPDRAGRRLPHGDGLPVRVGRLRRARAGGRVAADAPAAGGGRAAVAARARARRGRLRQRRQRRARLPPLPVHQHRADGPPHARAGRRVGLPRRGDAAGHARRRAGRGRAVRRAAAGSAGRRRRCSCGRADGSTERPAATGRSPQTAPSSRVAATRRRRARPHATSIRRFRAVYVCRQSPGRRRAAHRHSIRVRR